VTGPSRTPDKVIAREEAVSRARRERESGRRVVFANGAFDLLHAGHVRYLEAARAEGDWLLVAVNSDSSVARAKGEGRPIIPAAERAEIVAALACVDAVVVFGEDSPAVPEKDVVAQYGGRTVIVGDPKHHATTDLIDRIRKS